MKGVSSIARVTTDGPALVGLDGEVGSVLDVVLDRLTPGLDAGASLGLAIGNPRDATARGKSKQTIPQPGQRKVSYAPLDSVPKVAVKP